MHAAPLRSTLNQPTSWPHSNQSPHSLPVHLLTLKSQLSVISYSDSALNNRLQPWRWCVLTSPTHHQPCCQALWLLPYSYPSEMVIFWSSLWFDSHHIWPPSLLVHCSSPRAMSITFALYRCYARPPPIVQRRWTHCGRVNWIKSHKCGWTLGAVAELLCLFGLHCLPRLLATALNWVVTCPPFWQLPWQASSYCYEILDASYHGQSDARNGMRVSACQSLS